MSSNVWKYFQIDANDKFAKCSICKQLISRGGSSKTTSNMLKHLKKVHHIITTGSGTNKPKTSAQGTSTTLQPSSGSEPSRISAFFQTKSTSRPTTESLPSCTVVGPLVSETTGEAPATNMPTDSTDMEIGKSFDEQLHVDIYQDDPSEVSFGSELDPSLRPPSCSSTTPFTSPNSDLLTLGSSTPDPSGRASGDEQVSVPVLVSHEKTQMYPKRIKLGTKKQPTLDNLYDRITKFKSSDPRAKQITKLVCEMMCVDLQPLSVVENKGFKKLINHLEPRYTIPSRKTFSNKVLLDMYNEVHQKVKEELHLATYVAITTDMWTSIANEDYMAVTAHFYSGATYGIKLTHRCLEVVPFTEVSHTADNLNNFLSQVLSEWGVASKVVAVVRDNGTDITAALTRSQFQPIPCVAHTLQLVVKDGLINNIKMMNLLKKTKKLVGSFKHSAKNTKMLKACQTQLGLPQHRMIQDEPTRWNSSFHMLRRVIEQKEAIILVGSKSDIKLSVDMVPDDWKTMKFAVSILEIFEQATLQVSKSSSSVSEVIPLINTVQNVVENTDFQGSGLLGVKNDLTSSLKRRYPAVETNLTYACATILDPRFKAKPFENTTAFETAKAKIIEEMVAVTQTDSTPHDEPGAEPTASTSGTLSDKASKGLWSYYEDYFGKSEENVDSNSNASSCETELQQYLGEKNLNPKDGEQVPHYWANSLFIRLKSVAFKYLCIPPCTVFSERLFSTAGNICDVKRNRLDPDRVKMLVFLNKNVE